MEISKIATQRDFQRINLADLNAMQRNHDILEQSLNFIRKTAGNIHDWILPRDSQEPIILVFSDTPESN